MIVVTIFLSILNQMDFHLVQNRKENCHHDHIPLNFKGNGNKVFSVQRRSHFIKRCLDGNPDTPPHGAIAYSKPPIEINNKDELFNIFLQITIDKYHIDMIMFEQVLRKDKTGNTDNEQIRSIYWQGSMFFFLLRLTHPTTGIKPGGRIEVWNQ